MSHIVTIKTEVRDYAALIQHVCQIGRSAAGNLETVVERFLLTADPRDVLAARDSIRRLLDLPGPEH